MVSRASRAARLALKVGLGLLGLVLVCELGLQALALIVPDRAGHWREGARYRVLSMGDSHTWGSGVERGEAYPAQLQRALDGHAPGLYSVINRGLPGMSTTQLRNRFALMLARYQPDAVVIWCGANNLWNHAERDRRTTSTRLWLDGWLSRLRLYRLARVWLHDRSLEKLAEAEAGEEAWGVEGHDRVVSDEQRFDVRHDGVVERITHQRGADDPRLFDRTLEDLEAMAATARAAGVALVLVTYPLEKEFFSEVNRAIREAARRQGLPVVESPEALARIPRAERSWKWALHPDERLYAEVAADLAPRIVGARSGGAAGDASMGCAELLAPLTEGFGAPGPHAVVREVMDDPHWPGRLVSVYRPRDVERPPLVIFAHAHGNPDPESYAWFVHHVVSRGYALVYPSHQVSEIHSERYAALWDGVRAAVDAHGERFDLTRVGLVGHSYGAGALLHLAHRALVEEGWGRDGAFLFSLAPWYALGLEGRDLGALPDHLKVLFLVFEDDGVTDHRMAIAQRALLGAEVESDHLMLRSDARGGCELPAQHSVPQSAGLGGRNDAFDARAVFRLFDALAAYAFSGNEEGRRVALGRGDPAQVSMGFWVDGTPLRPMAWSPDPEPARSESAYLFQQGAEAEWRRRGEAGVDAGPSDGPPPSDGV